MPSKTSQAGTKDETHYRRTSWPAPNTDGKQSHTTSQSERNFESAFQETLEKNDNTVDTAQHNSVFLVRILLFPPPIGDCVYPVHITSWHMHEKVSIKLMRKGFTSDIYVGMC